VEVIINKVNGSSNFSFKTVGKGPLQKDVASCRLENARVLQRVLKYGLFDCGKDEPNI